MLGLNTAYRTLLSKIDVNLSVIVLYTLKVVVFFTIGYLLGGMINV